MGIEYLSSVQPIREHHGITIDEHDIDRLPPPHSCSPKEFKDPDLHHFVCHCGQP